MKSSDVYGLSGARNHARIEGHNSPGASMADLTENLHAITVAGIVGQVLGMLSREST